MALLWLLNVILSSTLFKLGLLIYCLIPVVIKFYPKIITYGTFLNFVCPPTHSRKLCTPEKIWKNVRGVTNHTINSEKGIKLGLWHISPQNTTESLATAKKVMLYCHGNAFHRGYGHRQNIYEIFRKEGYHVVAFDYRGFGDSTGEVSEKGVIYDTIKVYEWVLEQINQQKCDLYIWGHSLGTFIATEACLAIQNNSELKQPEGIFLESPFTNFSDMVHGYPLSKIWFKIYPGKWFTEMFYEAISKNNLQCNTNEVIMNLNHHFMIFHAKDDTTVPYHLGEKLFHEMLGSEKCQAKSVKFVAFKAEHGHGHNHIHESQKYPEFIGKMENVKISSNKFMFVEV